jgi:hypothetical protein
MLNYANEYSVLRPITITDGYFKCIIIKILLRALSHQMVFVFLFPSTQNRLGNESNQNQATLENQNCEKFMSYFGS